MVSVNLRNAGQSYGAQLADIPAWLRDEETAGSCKGLRRLISVGVPGLHEHPRLVR
jgi:hypothetical protein